LPEGSYLTYRDDGCEVAPHCLECPLAVCKYDNSRRSNGLDEDDWERRNVSMMADFKKTENAAATAMHFGVSIRTVHRIAALAART